MAYREPVQPGFRYSGGIRADNPPTRRKQREPAPLPPLERPNQWPGLAVEGGKQVFSTMATRKAIEASMKKAGEEATNKLAEKVATEGAKKAVTGEVGKAGVKKVATEGVKKSIYSNIVPGLGIAVSGYSAGQLGETIGEYSGLNEDQSRVAGAVSAFGAGFMAGGGPWGGVAGATAYGLGEVAEANSWLCTETKETIGLTDEEMSAVKELRKYARKEHGKEFLFYIRNGEDLTKAIRAKEQDIGEYYRVFKASVMNPVIRHIRLGDNELAYNHYAEKIKALFHRYMPELEGV